MEGEHEPWKSTERELTLLNFYRASELQGGLMLGRLVEHVRDPELILRLTEHSAEEVMHAQLWTETIVAVGGRPRPTSDTYQSRYAAAIGTPDVALEVLHSRRCSSAACTGTSFVICAGRVRIRRVQATLRRMLDDERGHLSWVKEWLDTRQTGCATDRDSRVHAPIHGRRRADSRKQLLRDYEWDELACAS